MRGSHKWPTKSLEPSNRPNMKKQPPKPPRDITIPVRCRDCARSSAFIENSCHCKAMGRRVCACNRYGRVCKYYSTK